jgi:cyclohexanecarboxyl-CoA dehydrogenase
MEFRFSDEEEDLRSAVSDFVRKELVEKELDKADRLPVHIVSKIGELGFLSLHVPPEYGGEPASWVDVGILVEEIAKGDIALAHFVTLSYEVSLLLANYGQKPVVEKWMPSLVKGTKLGSISFTEPEAGCDLAAMTTTAVRDGDAYVITGEKCPVSFGMQAAFTLLFAPIVSDAGAGGLTCFLLPLDLAGITRNPLAVTGLQSSAPASLTFNKVRIPLDYRLGEEGQGLDLNKRYGLFSDLSQILSALSSLGVCQAAFKQAASYAKERTAFGRPIGQFQAISGRIAENATLIEAGQWLCYRALWLKDQNLPNARQAAMCGWWCPSNAYRIIEDALLIHGHYGYSDEYPFQQMLRDVLAFQMIPGTGQTLQLLIAEDVIGTAAVPREMGGMI